MKETFWATNQNQGQSLLFLNIRNKDQLLHRILSICNSTNNNILNTFRKNLENKISNFKIHWTKSHVQAILPIIFKHYSTEDHMYIIRKFSSCNEPIHVDTMAMPREGEGDFGEFDWIETWNFEETKQILEGSL